MKCRGFLPLSHAGRDRTACNIGNVASFHRRVEKNAVAATGHCVRIKQHAGTRLRDHDDEPYSLS
ncbi:hypothetical protein GCM10011410_16170 [Hoyosella rhizosphaerae]|uniref:Uncharacterized protein n=1 Tax=Hoyosella rhizosphaerae TaxID=1755582 RepID=A0A916XEF5_9ACTN|nr:hypothetical protein GCM10011410_16170 [Hoyosella rhizosphaerae]